MTSLSTFQVQQAKFSTKKSMIHPGLRLNLISLAHFYLCHKGLKDFEGGPTRTSWRLTRPAAGSWCADGPGHLMQKYRLGGEGIESSPEKDLGLLMNEKLSMTWQQAFAAQKPTMPWAASQEVRPARREKWSCYFTLMRPLPGVLHPAVEASEGKSVSLLNIAQLFK